MCCGTALHNVWNFLSIAHLILLLCSLFFFNIYLSAMDINATKPDVVIPWEGTRRLTIRLYMEEPQGAVLGANFMYNYDVVYDLQQNRVGFARVFCGFDREAQDRLNKDREKMDKDEDEKEAKKAAANKANTKR